jgi:hypothetical protein
MSDRVGRFKDNTRGLGVALRFAGVVLPLVAFFAVFFTIGVPISRGVLPSAFRVAAFFWAWPYAMYQQQPFSFGSMAIVGIVATAILALRRDCGGAITVLVWCFFWGWLLAAIIGQDQGS